MEKKNRHIIKYIIYIFIIIILFIVAFFFFLKTNKDNKTFNLSYKDDSDIDYRVFLKDNNFFEEKFFDKDYLIKNKKTVISQLIDKISVTYTYSMNYSEIMDGKYSYQVKGIIEANKTNAEENGNVWSKEYDLTEKKEFLLERNNTFNLMENISVDYDQYNSLFTEFKKVYNTLSMDGLLKIVLVVQSEANNEIFDEPIVIDSESILEIPLSKSATEISISSQNKHNEKTLTKVIDQNSKYRLTYTIAYISALVLGILFTGLLIVLIIMDRKKNKFELTLKKILKTYDSIIVNVDSLPKVSDYNVIKVNSFDELIDAHSEIRMPINYYKKSEKEHKFILINDKTLWEYDLKK